MALLWILNLADGRHSMLDMADRSKLPFATIHGATKLLESHGLVFLDEAAPTPPAALSRDRCTSTNGGEHRAAVADDDRGAR